MFKAKQAKQSCEWWTWSLTLCGILGGAWRCHTVLNMSHFIPFLGVCVYGCGGIWRCTENINCSHGCLGHCFLIQNNDIITALFEASLFVFFFFLDCDLSRRSSVKFYLHVTSLHGLKSFRILEHFRFLSFWQAVSNIYKNNDFVWRSQKGGFWRSFIGQKCGPWPSSLTDQSHLRKGDFHCCYYFIYFYIFAYVYCVCLCVCMWKRVCMFVGACICGCISIHVRVDVCGS